MILKDHNLSIRKQCQILDIARSSHYYCPKEAFDDYLVMNLISEINQKYPYQEERFKIIKPITGKVEIQKAKDQLWLNFKIKTKISTNCDRCCN